MGTEGSGSGARVTQFPADLQRWAEIIRACESLCLLGARTLTGSIQEFPDDRCSGILESISEHSLVFPDEACDPTTTGQCVAAMQALMPTVRRFDPRDSESGSLPFQAVDPSDSDAFKPKPLYQEMGNVIPKLTDSLFLEEGYSSPLHQKNPGTFGALHPFTCAHILRAISPSALADHGTWWRSLFILLWYLNYASSQRGARGGTLSRDCPATAFLTSRCIDSVEICIEVWKRRRARITKILELLKDIEKTENEDAESDARREFLQRSRRDKEAFIEHRRAYADHVRKLIKDDLLEVLEQFAWDSAVSSVFTGWKTEIEKRLKKRVKAEKTAGASSGRDNSRDCGYFVLMTDALTKQFADESFLENSAARSERQRASNDRIDAEYMAPIRHLHGLFGSEMDKSGLAAGSSLGMPDMESLPTWVRNSYYELPTKAHQATRFRSLDAQHQSALRAYWHNHHDATMEAWNTLTECQKFISSVYDIYERIGRKDVELIPGMQAATAKLDCLIEQLKACIGPAIRWSDFVLHQHLAYARGEFHSRFDPCELAHSVRTVCRYGDAHDFETIAAALDAVAESQRADGTWPATQPFHWKETGAAVYALSIETAWALASAVNTITQYTSKFGLSASAVASRLTATYASLERAFQWLSGKLVSFPTPPILRERERPTKRVYGWCSDRISEPSVIHNWATAVALEFLLDYRFLLQQRVNATIRSSFLSYHWSGLHRMSKVSPTDLGSTPFANRINYKVKEIIRSHRRLDVVEMQGFFPSPPNELTADQFSLILYGPPGTSKTYLAKAIARELEWPLVMLSPSDFLAGGESTVEARAREIFQALNHGSRLVYFFDEIDELILDRTFPRETRRSVFSFLTPSFLTKFQDLRDAAKKQEFIFLIGTNYLDRIDPAARRTGRIDQKLLVIYPDEVSRANIVMNHLFDWMKTQKLGSAKERDVFFTRLEKYGIVVGVIKNTALLSLPSVHQICKKLWEKCQHNELDQAELDQLMSNLSAGQEFSFADYIPRKGSEPELIELLCLIPDTANSVIEGLLKSVPKEFRAAFADRMTPVREAVNARRSKSEGEAGKVSGRRRKKV